MSVNKIASGADNQLYAVFNQTRMELYKVTGKVLKEYIAANKIPAEKIGEQIECQMRKADVPYVLELCTFVHLSTKKVILRYRVYQIPINNDTEIQIGFQVVQGNEEFEPISVSEKETF